MLLWVACIVFMSVLGKRGEAAAHMLSARKNWELASLLHLPEQVHLPPGADIRPSSHNSSSTRGSCCPATACAQSPSPNPSPQSWQSNPLEKGWVKIWYFPICRSAWMLTLCLHKTEVSMCIFLPTHTIISSSWQVSPKASVCIGLIKMAFCFLSQIYWNISQRCCWKWGSHSWHRRRYCRKPHKISEFIKGQLKQEDCLLNSLKGKGREKLMQWLNKMRYAMLIKNKNFDEK